MTDSPREEPRPDRLPREALRVLDGYLDRGLDDELDRVSHLLRDELTAGKVSRETLRLVLAKVDEYRDYRSSPELDRVATLLRHELADD